MNKQCQNRERNFRMQGYIHDFSFSVRSWIAGDPIILERYQIEEWVKFLCSHEQPIMAIKLIRQAYKCTLDEGKIIKDAIVRN